MMKLRAFLVYFAFFLILSSSYVSSMKDILPNSYSSLEQDYDSYKILLKNENERRDYIVILKEPSLSEVQASVGAKIQALEKQQTSLSTKSTGNTKLKKDINILYKQQNAIIANQAKIVRSEHQRAIKDFNRRLEKPQVPYYAISLPELPFITFILNIFGRFTGYSVEEEKELTPSYEYFLAINGFSFKGISVEQANSIASSPYVKKVYPDTAMRTLLSESVSYIDADKVWTLDKNSGNCKSTNQPCITGEGVKVAVIDTGIDYTHSDFGKCTKKRFGDGECGNIIGGYDFFNGDDDPMDDNGHGTHVASTIASNGEIKGVAPGVQILAYKVLDSYGNGNISTVIAGIERAMDPNGDKDFRDHVQIISLSIGSPGDPDDLVSQIVDSATTIGILSVVAAGNSGPEAETINSPGSARTALTVGAIYKNGNVAEFSSRGIVTWKNGTLLKPDVVAPGVSICAAESSENKIWSELNKKGYDIHCYDKSHISISGTSMATPHVSGIAALLKQAHPDWTPEELKNAIRMSAKDINLDYNVQGYGSVNALKAFQSSRPLHVSLEKLGVLSGKSYLNGTFTPNFPVISLSYGSGLRPTTWNDIPLSSENIRSGSFSNILDTHMLEDGVYTLRLNVGNEISKTSEDRVIFFVNNYDISELEDHEIFGPGSYVQIPIYLKSLEEGDKSLINYSMEYISQNNGSWKSEGILRCQPQNKESMDYDEAPLEACNNSKFNTNLLYVFNTSEIHVAGEYTFRVHINSNVPGNFEENVSRIYIDPTLRIGWPQINSFGFDILRFRREYPIAQASDIDNDGKKEIIVHEPVSLENPSGRLIVYNSNGTILWQKSFEDNPYFNASNFITLFSSPIITDIDGDGYDEIVAHLINFNFEAQVDPLSAFDYLVAYNFKGEIIPDKIVKVPHNIKSTMIARDLDNDGLSEIIIEQHSFINYRAKDDSSIDKLIIIKNNSIFNSWIIPGIQSSAEWSSEPLPAIGNFDDDSDLEIVVERDVVGFRRDTRILVYNIDGSEVSGWPVKIPVRDNLHGSTPSVADINNDGMDDIIISVGDHSPDKDESTEIYVLSRNGSIQKGFPLSINLSIPASGLIAIGDVNNDGFSEIAFGTSRQVEPIEPILNGAHYIINHEGKILPGWPKFTRYSSDYNPIIADVDGDGFNDFLIGSASIFDSVSGGIYAWHRNGSLVNGFPKATSANGQDLPQTITDIDGDGLTELIGSTRSDYNFEKKIFKNRFSVYVWNLGVPWTNKDNTWISFAGDISRSSCASCKNLDAGSTTIINPDMQYVSHYTLENKKYAKIEFKDSLNVSKVALNKSLLNHILITHNKVRIETELLPELNKSAFLVFKSVNLFNPKILYNGASCPDSVCTNITYNSLEDTFSVNVKHFSEFELVEDIMCGDNICQVSSESCSSCSIDCGVCPADIPSLSGNTGEGGRGSGGSSRKCLSNWQCKTEECLSNIQVKRCVDLNKCTKFENITKTSCKSDNVPYLNNSESTSELSRNLTELSNQISSSPKYLKYRTSLIYIEITVIVLIIVLIFYFSKRFRQEE